MINNIWMIIGGNIKINCCSSVIGVITPITDNWRTGKNQNMRWKNILSCKVLGFINHRLYFSCSRIRSLGSELILSISCSLNPKVFSLDGWCNYTNSTSCSVFCFTRCGCCSISKNCYLNFLSDGRNFWTLSDLYVKYKL